MEAKSHRKYHSYFCTLLQIFSKIKFRSWFKRKGFIWSGDTLYILADQPIYLILRLLHWHHQGLLHNSILFCCEMGSLGQIWQINSILDWNRVGGGYLVYPLIMGKLIWFCLESMVKKFFLDVNKCRYIS